MLSEVQASEDFSGRQIVTELEAAKTFWAAEDYHQDYIAKTGRACHVNIPGALKVIGRDPADLSSGWTLSTDSAIIVREFSALGMSVQKWAELHSDAGHHESITMPQPHISSSGKLRINPNIDPIFGALDCINPMNPKMDPMKA